METHSSLIGYDSTAAITVIWEVNFNEIMNPYSERLSTFWYSSVGTPRWKQYTVGSSATRIYFKVAEVQLTRAVQTCVVQWSTLWLGIQLCGCTYTWVSHSTGRRGIIHGSTVDEKSLLSFFKCFGSIKFVEDYKALLCQLSSLGFCCFISRVSNSWQVCHREPSAGCQYTLLLFVYYKS